jgi:beta-lactamase class D
MMKKFALFLCSLFLCVNMALAETSCFLAKENGKVLKSEGDCTARHNPGCDFSIVLSLMGFDAGVLKDENSPEWHYKEGYETFLNFWKTTHTPKTWIINSCVWYSGNIVAELGFKKIDAYIRQFEYGNQDIKGMDRTDWPGALLISAQEQVDFLQRFLDRKLSVSAKAYEMTEKLLYIQELAGGWKLYGKTGNGEGKGTKRAGWFIGWIAKDKRRIPFASCVVVNFLKLDDIPSFKARGNAVNKLFWLINEFEK